MRCGWTCSNLECIKCLKSLLLVLFSAESHSRASHSKDLQLLLSFVCMKTLIIFCKLLLLFYMTSQFSDQVPAGSLFYCYHMNMLLSILAEKKIKYYTAPLVFLIKPSFTGEKKKERRIKLKQTTQEFPLSPLFH